MPPYVDPVVTLESYHFGPTNNCAYHNFYSLRLLHPASGFPLTSLFPLLQTLPRPLSHVVANTCPYCYTSHKVTRRTRESSSSGLVSTRILVLYDPAVTFDWLAVLNQQFQREITAWNTAETRRIEVARAENEAAIRAYHMQQEAQRSATRFPVYNNNNNNNNGYLMPSVALTPPVYSSPAPPHTGHYLTRGSLRSSPQTSSIPMASSVSSPGYFYPGSPPYNPNLSTSPAYTHLPLPSSAPVSRHSSTRHSSSSRRRSSHASSSTSPRVPRSHHVHSHYAADNFPLAIDSDDDEDDDDEALRVRDRTSRKYSRVGGERMSLSPGVELGSRARWANYRRPTCESVAGDQDDDEEEERDFTLFP